MVHSKNQMTPELVEFVAWVLTECSKIAKTIVIIGNHDFLENNNARLDALTPIVDSLKNDNIVYLKNRGVYSDDNVNWCVYSLTEHNIPPDIEKSENKNIGLFLIVLLCKQNKMIFGLNNIIKPGPKIQFLFSSFYYFILSYLDFYQLKIPLKNP